MKAGERIRLIEESARVLEGMPRGRMQLILRQHGAKTYDDFDDGFDAESVETYATGRAETLNDQNLVDLHAYLLGDDAAPAQQPAVGRPWGTNPAAVFVSHVHEDAAFAGKVRDLLSKWWGIDAFVAHTDIDPSAAWRATIRSRLASCHFMVAILHDRFHLSQWCDQEVGWAMGRGIPVMPVRLGPAPHRRDGFMEEYQDLTLDVSRADHPYFLAETIFDRLLANPMTHTVGVGALVEAFVHSPNYRTTDKLVPLLHAEPTLNRDQLRRLEYAVQTNNQVYDCVTGGKPVPAHVQEIVAKFEPPQPADPWATASGEPPF